MFDFNIPKRGYDPTDYSTDNEHRQLKNCLKKYKNRLKELTKEKPCKKFDNDCHICRGGGTELFTFFKDHKLTQKECMEIHKADKYKFDSPSSGCIGWRDGCQLCFKDWHPDWEPEKPPDVPYTDEECKARHKAEYDALEPGACIGYTDGCSFCKEEKNSPWNQFLDGINDAFDFLGIDIDIAGFLEGFLELPIKILKPLFDAFGGILSTFGVSLGGFTDVLGRFFSIMENFLTVFIDFIVKGSDILLKLTDVALKLINLFIGAVDFIVDHPTVFMIIGIAVFLLIFVFEVETLMRLFGLGSKQKVIIQEAPKKKEENPDV